MIKLSQLAENIDNRLNDELASRPIDTERCRYEFYIVADTTDYKKAERKGNEVTFYIQGMLHQIDSNIEASQGGAISAAINTRLDILVPVLDGNDEEGNKELVKSVRNILDTCFAASGAGVITDAGETDYSYSYKYSLSNTGTRAQLPMIGDAFIFTAHINYYFVQDGINSQMIELYIYDDPVPYTAIGIHRNTTQEANLPANSEDGAARNVNASTLLSINFVAPARSSPWYRDYVALYLLDGRQSALNVHLDINGAKKDTTMYISDASMNGETVLNASVSVTLSETMLE